MTADTEYERDRATIDGAHAAPDAAPDAVRGVADAGRSTPPEQPPQVLVSGGDPMALGLMAFALGTLVVGMSTVGVFPASALGGAVPIVFGFCAIALFTSTWWSYLHGATLLAATFGTVSGFFFSLAALLLGLAHNWYGVAAADTYAVQEIFYIVWCCFFIALFIPFLRFPVIYPLTVFFVVVLLALGATAVFTGSATIATASGAATLLVSLLLFWEWLHVTMTAVGMRKVPPLGPVVG